MDELDRPYLVAGFNGQPRPHPLLRLIVDAEMLADRLPERLRVKFRGPNPVAVVSPLPSPAPSARLKMAHQKRPRAGA